MDGSLYVTSPMLRLAPGDNAPSQPQTSEVQLLLRQVLEIQKEQLAVLKAQQAANDSQSRWRAFLARWNHEFPGVGSACRTTLPIVERAYLTLLEELTDKLQSEDADIDNEFALSEFLDRYGMKLGQLGSVLSQLGPIADAAKSESASQ